MEKSFQKWTINFISNDVLDDPVRQNVLTEKGVKRFLDLLSLASLKPGSFVWVDPPCSWFVWMSSSIHKRTAGNPIGDLSHPEVRRHNRIAEFAANVMQVCHAFGMAFVFEQPYSSVMPHFPQVAAALTATRARKIVIHLGKFGAKTVKPLQLWGTVPWLKTLQEVAGYVHVGNLRPRFGPWPRAPAHTRSLPWRIMIEASTETLTETTESGQVNGKKEEMSESSAYPELFCDVVAQLHRWELAKAYHDQVVQILMQKFSRSVTDWFPDKLGQYTIGVVEPH